MYLLIVLNIAECADEKSGLVTPFFRTGTVSRGKA
jgi:hypothetical protein